MANNVLDLTCFTEKTLEVKMPDGRKLNLPKPSQRVLILVLALEKKNGEKKNEEEMLNDINQLVLTVLNSNKQGYSYKITEVENLPIDAKIAIIKAYSDFATDLVNNPN